MSVILLKGNQFLMTEQVINKKEKLVMVFTPVNIKIKLGITGKHGDHKIGAVSTKIQVMHHNPYMEKTCMSQLK